MLRQCLTEECDVWLNWSDTTDLSLLKHRHSLQLLLVRLWWSLLTPHNLALGDGGLKQVRIAFLAAFGARRAHIGTVCLHNLLWGKASLGL